MKAWILLAILAIYSSNSYGQRRSRDENIALPSAERFVESLKASGIDTILHFSASKSGCFGPTAYAIVYWVQGKSIYGQIFTARRQGKSYYRAMSKSCVYYIDPEPFKFLYANFDRIEKDTMKVPSWNLEGWDESISATVGRQQLSYSIRRSSLSDQHLSYQKILIQKLKATSLDQVIR